jgi:Peptidase S24-like
MRLPVELAKSYRLLIHGPTFIVTSAHADPLLVDTGVNGIRGAGVYVFLLNDLPYIKRLQRRTAGNIIVISYNKMYDSEIVPQTNLDELLILRSVLLVWTTRKLELPSIFRLPSGRFYAAHFS